jgi:ubiquinone/menaquinone biosynthesis C-methylase UbiE
MNRQPEASDLEVIKERQQRSWASGDYAMLGSTFVVISELLCEAVDLRSGQEVLDVATGSGNTALAAARRFCEVTGVDYVPDLLKRARERAAAERLRVSFQEGDAENVPFPDATFDVVLSTIGAMFAPDQQRAAGELLRVCRAGGTIGMANWVPDGFIGEMLRVHARYLPPPPGLEPPVLWGTEERVRELFGEYVASLQATRRVFFFRYRSVEHYWDFMRTHNGPTIGAFQALDATARENLEGELMELTRRFNRSGDGTMIVPADYLEIVATRR